jgi:hypothetical protein
MVTAPKDVDYSRVRINVTTPLGTFRSSNTGVTNFRAEVEVATDGTFRREGLPLGEYRLLATHPLFGPYRTRFELQPGKGTGPLEIALGSFGTVVVHIVGTDGRGLVAEHVALHRGDATPEHVEYRLEPASPEVGAGFTDAEGEVRFTDLQPGPYTVTRRGTVIEQRAAVVRPAIETIVLFDASASLFGSLLGHDGQPISEAKLLLRASGGRFYETRTDDGGTFAIRGIAAGDYSVTASVKGLGTIPLAETLAIEHGHTHQHELRLPSIRLTGSVTHAESGAPFTSRRVSVTASATNLTFRMDARTTADGRFELAGLYPARYSIVAYPVPPDDAYEEAALDVVTVAPMPANQELVLHIPRVAKTARLRLTVRDRSGKPAENLVFSIDGRIRTQYANGVSRSRDATLVEPGVYDILLVPGTHSIHVNTQPSGPEPDRGSCYWEEFSIELEAGQAADKAITLEKLLGG